MNIIIFFWNWIIFKNFQGISYWKESAITSLSSSDSKESACHVGNSGSNLGQEDLLEKGMTTHSNIFAWRIPQTEEPGGLQPTELQRVRHHWATFTLPTCMNLDSILNSRDITLSTKVHLVKAMVFPVVMYGCENWTIKKAECWRIDAFELWYWRRLLRVLWTARRSNQSI